MNNSYILYGEIKENDNSNFFFIENSENISNIYELNLLPNENEEGSIDEEHLYFITQQSNNAITVPTSVNENVIINNEQRTSTDYCKKIFLRKVNKKKPCNKENMGRYKKDEIIDKDNENVHSKYKPDNIRIKFKRGFLNYLIIFINLLIGKSNKLKKKGYIQKIDSCIIRDNKKEYILKMLDMSAKDFLSLPITKKIKRLDRDHNEKLIKYIYEVNEISVIEVLNKGIRELMFIFCSNIIQDNIFKHFKRLQYYIDNDLSNEDPLYIKKFKYHALNFEDEYKDIDGRYEDN